MSSTEQRRGNRHGVHVERLDHLGIVAGICSEFGLAVYLDALAGPTWQQVSVGTATIAKILNPSFRTFVRDQIVVFVCWPEQV